MLVIALALGAGCGPGDSGVDASTAAGTDAIPSGDDGSTGGEADAAATDGRNLGCVLVPGSWQIMGACGATICMIQQTGCAITLSCTDGASYSGSLSGDTISYDDGGSTACTGRVTGDTIRGTCTIDGSDCDLVATR